MPLLTPEQGHFDQLLTDYSQLTYNDPASFAAQRVATVKPVMQKSGDYWVYTKEFWFQTVAGPRPLGGKPRERHAGLTTDTYGCTSQWVSAYVDDEERANATPPHDPEQDAVDLIMQDLLLRRELDFTASALVSTPWTTKRSGVASAPNHTSTELQWDQSAAVPGTIIRTYQNTVKKLTGQKPNVLVLGADLAVSLIDTADFQDKVKYTGTGGVIADATEMKKYFNVDDIIIADAVQNTADEGQTMAGGFIMDSKSALLVYRSPSIGLKTATAITVFAWTGLLAGAAYSPTVVTRGRNDERHSDWFHGGMAYDIKVTAPDMGVFFSAMIA